MKEATLSDWMSVKEAADYARKSQNHIRHLLRTGLVQGRKFGRDWFTTKEALDEYLATDPRPGPKTNDP